MRCATSPSSTCSILRTTRSAAGSPTTSGRARRPMRRRTSRRGADGTPATYLVRVAEVVNNTASGGLPTLTVRFAAQDVTPPHIHVALPAGHACARRATTYDATDTDDNASQVDPQTARWEFHDALPDERRRHADAPGPAASRTRGSRRAPHEVDLHASRTSPATRPSTASRRSCRTSCDRTSSSACARPSPAPAGSASRCTPPNRSTCGCSSRSSAATSRSCSATLSFWGDRTQPRSVPLRGGVGRGLLVISGFARDLAGNTHALPQCVVDPVSGQGRCTAL